MDGPDEVDGALVDGADEELPGSSARPSRWAARADDGQLPRPWRLARRSALVLAAVAVVAAGARAVSQPGHPAKHGSAAVHDAAGSGPLDDVRALAETPGELTDYVRVDTPAGTCPLVRPGRSPVAAVLRAEHAQLGAVQLVDSASTIDQATGLCELAVRSKLHDTVITVSITPEPRPKHFVDFDQLEIGGATIGGLAVEYARVISRDQWHVIVGATGRRQRDLPDSQQLLDVAQTRQMIW